jgi:hypothetical protein
VVSILPKPFQDIYSAYSEIVKTVGAFSQCHHYQEQETGEFAEKAAPLVRVILRVLAAVPIAMLLAVIPSGLVTWTGLACLVISVPSSAIAGCCLLGFAGIAQIINAVVIRSFQGLFLGCCLLAGSHLVGTVYDSIPHGILEYYLESKVFYLTDLLQEKWVPHLEQAHS